jgi:predicted acyltransferase
MQMFKKLKNSLDRIDPKNSPAVTGRILSVDALRGFDMLWITGGAAIIVTLNDAVHSSFTEILAANMEHVPWQGFHFLDIVMPLFLFVTGVSMPLSFKKRLEKPQGSTLIKHILKRVCILWILGMIAQGNLLTYDWSKIAFFSNTLQAIAVGYLVSSVMILNLSVFSQFLWVLALLIINFIVLYYIPVPGVGHAVLEPQQNIALYIDKLLLGSHQDGTNYTWILTSIGFSVTVMTGVFASYILQGHISQSGKLKVLSITGLILVAAGLILNPVQLIIKHVWTTSFTLFSGGLCFLLLALFYLVVDYWKYQRWALFFIVVGSNSILAYMVGDLHCFSEIAEVFLLGTKRFLGDWYPFVLSVGSYTVFWLFFYFLYRRKIFIKV